jgi:hypothetical protein
MKLIIIILAVASLIATASATYTPEQQAMYDGTQLSWKMAVAYTNQDTSAYNALVDQWNAWVYQNFGQDPNMLMQKMNAPLDLTKPIVTRNNTTSGIQHKIDGNRWSNRTIKTNDANLLTQAELEANRAANPGMGEGYLPPP